MRLDYRIYPVTGARNSDDNSLAATDTDMGKARETGSLTQVSDGSVLWSHWVNASQQEVTRRTIADILEAVEDIDNYSTANSLQDLGVGGLQTLMARLQTGMDFGPVQEQEMADRKFLVLSGRWSEETRLEVFRIPEQNLELPLPGHIPDYVRIYVDAASQLPRRIQYLKRFPDPKQNRVRPLVTLDLLNVSSSPTIDDTTFANPNSPEFG